jgi:hypothetical protein
MLILVSRILVDGLMDTVAPVTDEELEIYKVRFTSIGSLANPTTSE